MVVLAEKLAEQSEKIRRPRVPFPEIELPQLNPVTMPLPPAPSTPIRSPGAVSISRTKDTIASNDMSEHISVPTMSGQHQVFNYTTRRMSTQVLVRMIVHSGLEMQDIEYDWLSSQKLQLRMAWPDWFQYPEQMATFVLDENGLPVFPPEHQLTFDMAARNEQLIEEDNRIWDSGLITFDQEMTKY